jgi:hypothetical protein
MRAWSHKAVMQGPIAQWCRARQAIILLLDLQSCLTLAKNGPTTLRRLWLTGVVETSSRLQ